MREKHKLEITLSVGFPHGTLNQKAKPDIFKFI